MIWVSIWIVGREIGILVCIWSLEIGTIGINVGQNNSWSKVGIVIIGYNIWISISERSVKVSLIRSVFLSRPAGSKPGWSESVSVLSWPRY